MYYFNLIFDECKKLNNLLEGTFKNNELFFIEANISEITYGLDGNSIIFGYYPERYEYGKIMLLKDISIQISFDKNRQYSVKQLYSFFNNNCKFYEDSSTLKPLEELIRSMQYVLFQMNSNKSNWEQKFNLYKKTITPDWGE